MSSAFEEPGRFTISISENPHRRMTPWDWSVRDNKTGIERFGRSSRESWARHDAEKALRRWREGKEAPRERAA